MGNGQSQQKMIGNGQSQKKMIDNGQSDKKMIQTKVLVSSESRLNHFVNRGT